MQPSINTYRTPLSEVEAEVEVEAEAQAAETEAEAEAEAEALEELRVAVVVRLMAAAGWSPSPWTPSTMQRSARLSKQS
jgi:regulator of protease activity HflC (stomatin/prohibitin superfamily)